MSERSSFTVGEDPSSDFLVSGIHPPQILVENGESVSPSVSFGDVTFSFQKTSPETFRSERKVDTTFLSFLGGVSLLFLTFFGLSASIPPDPLSVGMEAEEASLRFASYFHQKDEIEEEEPILPKEISSSKGGGGPSGGGKKGSGKGSSRKNSPGPLSQGVPSLGRNSDLLSDARGAGILGVLGDSSFLVSGPGAFSLGMEDGDIWNSVTGTGDFDDYGLIGTGRSGGDGNNLVNMGKTGLIGEGKEGRSSPKIGFGGHEKKVPQPKLGDGKVSGDMDRDLIRRIVRSHLNEVRSCYNEGLTRNPNMEGRVTIQWGILGNGKVSSVVVSENSLKDTKVSDCITKSVKRWTFPRKGNSGVVIVSYPFLLKKG